MRPMAFCLLLLLVSCARREPDFSYEISKGATGFNIDFKCVGDEMRCLEKITEKVMAECRPPTCAATLTKSSTEHAGGKFVLRKLWRCDTK